MLPPILIDLADANQDWHAFAISAAVTAGVGITMILTSQGARADFRLRAAFVLTTASWIMLSLFAALPFWFSDMGISFTDAVFESVSGLTTTGATIIVGLDHSPRGILLWRALLHGIGGIGIVVMAVLILPFLRVGGQQLFRAESSDKSDKPFPRLKQVVSGILVVYVGLNLACLIALMATGFGWFDALTHALSTVSTGGFSTKDSSIGFFGNPAAEWILALFMALSSFPLIWFLAFSRGGVTAALQDRQVGTFVSLLFGCIVTMWVWLLLTQNFHWSDSLRLSAFNVISIISTTGFVTSDYSQWGSFAGVAFMLFFFIGGCSGSTAGAIKIFRWQILFLSLRQQMLRMVQPNRVMPLLYNNRKIEQDELQAIINFIFIYVFIFAILSAALSVTGLDWLSSFSAVAASMANAGPGLGPIIGPAGTFQPVNDIGIWILSIAMLLGRLEIFTLLVLFMPAFWRD